MSECGEGQFSVWRGACADGARTERLKVGGELDEGRFGAEPHQPIGRRPRATAGGALAGEIGDGSERLGIHGTSLHAAASGRQHGAGGEGVPGLGRLCQRRRRDREERRSLAGVASGLAEATNVKGMCHEYW